MHAVPDEKPAQPTPQDVEPLYTQPSVRVLQVWTPAQVRSAISSADGGHMSLAAELCDNLLADESIGGAIETRTGGLQGLPLTFQDGRGDEAGDSPLAPELTEDWTHSYPEEETKQLAAWGLMLGVGFAEQVWTEEDGRFRPRLKFWHPKHFLFDQTINRWTVRTADEGMIVIEPNDPKWVVYTPYGSHRPWARGLWRGLSRWWLVKNYAIGDMGAHGEKAAMLVITATGERSPTAGQREQLANELQDVGKDGVAALPTGFNIELIEAKSSIKELYISQVEAANSAFVLAINGQNLTTEVKGGSLAAAAVHERVEARRIRSDGQTLSTTLHDQSLVYWTEWNFGASAVAPWPQWDTDPPDDQQAKATVFDTHAAALVKVKAAGFKVKDIDEMSAEAGIPELEEIEDVGGVDGSEDDAKGVAGNGPNSDGNDPNASSSSSGPSAQAFTLASGQPLAQASGFVNGQLHADALAAHAARAQARDTLVASVIKALDIGDDYDAIRTAVMEAYADEATPEELAETFEKVFIMAQRAGHVAVDEDI